MRRYNQVVVIGASDDNSFIDEAYKIGRYIASNGWVLITGGRGGIMKSASKGAFEENGIVIGILPDSDSDYANEYCNIVIPTGIGYARNMINVLSGDVIIAIGGKSGTLSELAYAWQFGKPIILSKFAHGWSENLSTMQIDDRREGIIYIAESLEDIFNHLNTILS